MKRKLIHSFNSQSRSSLSSADPLETFSLEKQTKHENIIPRSQALGFLHQHLGTGCLEPFCGLFRAAAGRLLDALLQEVAGLLVADHVPEPIRGKDQHVPRGQLHSGHLGSGAHALVLQPMVTQGPRDRKVLVHPAINDLSQWDPELGPGKGMSFRAA